MEVYDMANLVSLSFPELTYAGELYLYHNDQLPSLSGSFPSLETIESALYLEELHQLPDLTGAFPLLSSINGSVFISNNSVLDDITGLHGASIQNCIEVWSNPNITEAEGQALVSASGAACYNWSN